VRGAIDRHLGPISERDPACYELAHAVAAWAIRDMQDKKGYFLLSAVSAHQSQNADAPLGQATMFKALANLLLQMRNAETPEMTSGANETRLAESYEDDWRSCRSGRPAWSSRSCLSFLRRHGSFVAADNSTRFCVVPAIAKCKNTARALCWSTAERIPRLRLGIVKGQQTGLAVFSPIKRRAYHFIRQYYVRGRER